MAIAPSCSVRRGWLVNVLGGTALGLGLATGLYLDPIHHLLQGLHGGVSNLTEGVPNALSTIFLMGMGLTLVFRGQPPAAQAIADPLPAYGDIPPLGSPPSQLRHHHGPKIVAIGGGTGLSSLLKGLKEYSDQITAIVTVADDGGSSGRLRQSFGIQPPGDLRNCLTALAEEEKLLTQLFQYRFESGDELAGHSLGNLFLTAMTHITGDMEQAAMASAKVLATRGRVLPATLCDMHLWADLTDGRRIHGESAIAAAKGQISRLGCIPETPMALPAALQAIAEADCIILGPGSLYTSILPNLLVPEIRQAIAQAQVPRIYVCNIMTQPGETTAYSVADHLRAIDRVCGQRLFDQVVVHQGTFSPHTLANYAATQSYPVVLDPQAVARLGCELVISPVAIEDAKQGIRHHPQRLARTLMRALQPVLN